MEKNLAEFCHKYDATAKPSHTKYRRIKRMDYSMWSESDPTVFNTLPCEDIEMVEIHMPMDRFRALLEHDDWISKAGLLDNRHFTNNVSRVAHLIVEHDEECRLRHTNPALKKAWENYQMLLRLVR